MLHFEIFCGCGQCPEKGRIESTDAARITRTHHFNHEKSELDGGARARLSMPEVAAPAAPATPPLPPPPPAGGLMQQRHSALEHLEEAVASCEPHVELLKPLPPSASAAPSPTPDAPPTRTASATTTTATASPVHPGCLEPLPPSSQRSQSHVPHGRCVAVEACAQGALGPVTSLTSHAAPPTATASTFPTAAIPAAVGVACPHTRHKVERWLGLRTSPRPQLLASAARSDGSRQRPSRGCEEDGAAAGALTRDCRYNGVGDKGAGGAGVTVGVGEWERGSGWCASSCWRELPSRESSSSSQGEHGPAAASQDALQLQQALAHLPLSPRRRLALALLYPPSTTASAPGATESVQQPSTASAEEDSRGKGGGEEGGEEGEQLRWHTAVDGGEGGSGGGMAPASSGAGKCTCQAQASAPDLEPKSHATSPSPQQQTRTTEEAKQQRGREDAEAETYHGPRARGAYGGERTGSEGGRAVMLAAKLDRPEVVEAVVAACGRFVSRAHGEVD